MLIAFLMVATTQCPDAAFEAAGEPVEIVTDVKYADGNVIEGVMHDVVTPTAGGLATSERRTFSEQRDDPPTLVQRFLGIVPISATSPAKGVEQNVRLDRSYQRKVRRLQKGKVVRFAFKEEGSLRPSEVGKYKVSLLRCEALTIAGDDYPVHVYEVVRTTKGVRSNDPSTNIPDSKSRSTIYVSDDYFWPLKVQTDAFVAEASTVMPVSD